jgi:hypothetical protein
MKRKVYGGQFLAFAAASVLAAPPSASENLNVGIASPIYGVTIPSGYRKWQLSNPIAVQAIRSATLPFPDGTILAKLAWKRTPSTEFAPASVPGFPTTVQFMIKDSKKYASTGGWGFGRFVKGKPADLAQHQTCFECHQSHVKNHDLVFTRLAP